MKVSKALLRRAVAALRDQAALSAGLSQGETLHTRKETQEWEDAKTLDACIRGLPVGREIECEDVVDPDLPDEAEAGE